MGYVALEKLLDKNHDSIYKLVILASKRALEIAEGRPKLVEAPLTMKPSTVALHEVAENKIEWKRLKAKD